MTATGLIQTLPDHCRMCYTCVRECPAKAIRIYGGQAEVVGERCVGCGNCVIVCRQHAKQVASSIPAVRALLAGDAPVALLLAPSFPAEYGENAAAELVPRLRRLGFELVGEVAFGADLVAEAYARLLAERPGERFIATTCPAIVHYVEKYHPDLVGSLAPIVSPMTAAARAFRQAHGEELRVVFAGPCLAKKTEALRGDDVDAVLTFVELRELVEESEGRLEMARSAGGPVDEFSCAFDPPSAGLGRLFPVARGMLQAAGLDDGLLAGDVVAVDGRRHAVEALAEFGSGALDARLLEALSCNGCIMGAGMSRGAPLFRRRAAVAGYARQRQEALDPAEHGAALARAREIPLERGYRPDDQRVPAPSPRELGGILEGLGKRAPADELDCGACGYETCREHAVAIHKGLAESEMCLPYTIERLKRSLGELSESNERLASTRQALFNAEKLASMGQLSAGIAHEVNNPLGVILLYAKMALDELPADADSREDLEMIVEQAERCRKIVGGLLGFARRTRIVRRDVDLGELVRQGLRALQLPDSVALRLDLPAEPLLAQVDGDQLLQVLTNLAGNAAEAMPEGGELRIAVEERADQAAIVVSDTGTGIAPQHLGKIFEPLFTTKQLGKGTGLGLAVSYGIVKMHQGRIDVRTNADPSRGPTGTTFSVVVPRRSPESPGLAGSGD